MLKILKKAAAKLAGLFATTANARPSAEWRRVYGDGAPAFTIE